MDAGALRTVTALTILETCLYADDLVAAERFYRDVLGLQLVNRKAGRHIFFRCGSTMLLVFRSGSRRGCSPAWVRRSRPCGIPGSAVRTR
jgi:catechol 2,3-dioxygenase-like lactoylglutathione lyase family enzyme